jgi:hypothetical protein
MRVKTNRKIRAYEAQDGKLVPVGGFKKNRVIYVRAKRPKVFVNAKFPAVELIGLKGVQGKVYVLMNPKNIHSSNKQLKAEGADGVNQNCENSAFQRSYIAASADSGSLDFGTDEQFHNAGGYEQDNGSEFPADFNADGEYEGADGLMDDSYCCDEGEGFLTPAQIAKLSKKELKKYKKSMRIHKMQSKTQGKAADAALNKSLATAVAETGSTAPAAAGAGAPAATGDGKIMGLPKMAVIGGGVFVALVVVGAIVMLSGKKKPSGGAGAAAAPAPAAAPAK